MKKILCFFTMCMMMLLAACGASVQRIEQMPYPEAEDNAYGVSMDYWSTNSFEQMWECADFVVVGKYRNVAPESVNINRNPLEPTQEIESVYYEQLVYIFEIADVLKGEIDEEDIRLGHFHGLKVEEKTYPFETFQQPDTQSYKVMFLLYTEYGDFYYPCVQDWWLSTEAEEMDTYAGQENEWVNMQFEVEDTVGQKPARQLDVFADSKKNAAYREKRTSCTGAELLALAG